MTSKPPPSPLRKGNWASMKHSSFFFFFCHASQEPRNERNNSLLLSMLKRAERHGSTKSFSVARVASGQSCPASLKLRGHTSTQLTMHSHLGAGDAWRSRHNDPD